MKKDITAAKKELLKFKNRILIYLKQLIKKHEFNYETFGKAVEQYIVGELIRFYTENGFILKEADYQIARNKNEFPEFILNVDRPFAIDVKAGNMSRKKGNQWITTKNSNNDLGTLHDWPRRLRKFGENIYFIFIIYNFNDQNKEIVDIQIEPFYKILALNKNNVLKYREKDGHLRPKDFYAPSKIQAYSQFVKLLKKTNIYRSSRIIVKHSKNLPKEILKGLLKLD